MGAKKSRRKGMGKKAYLKHHKSFYDPYSPYALRTRGVKMLDFVSPIPVVITHGKRGLTIGRAEQIPQMAAAIKHSNMLLQIAEGFGDLWKSDRHHKLPEWNRIVIRNSPRYTLELWFHGQEWIFVEEDRRTSIQRRSKVYPSKERAYKVFEYGQIRWDETKKIPAPCRDP